LKRRKGKKDNSKKLLPDLESRKIFPKTPVALSLCKARGKPLSKIGWQINRHSMKANNTADTIDRKTRETITRIPNLEAPPR
jgi:hypothetical protein